MRARGGGVSRCYIAFFLSFYINHTIDGPLLTLSLSVFSSKKRWSSFFFLFPRIYGRLFLAWLVHSWQPAAPPYREWRKRFHRFFWAAFFKRDFCFFWVLKSAAANGLCFFSLNLLFFPLRDVFFLCVCVCVSCCCQVTGALQKSLSIGVYSSV